MNAAYLTQAPLEREDLATQFQTLTEGPRVLAIKVKKTNSR